MIAVFWSFSELAVTRGAEVARAACVGEAERLANEYKHHIGTLSMLIGRSKMLGMDNVAALLEQVAEHRNGALRSVEFNAGVPTKAAIAELREACAALEKTRSEFHEAIRGAFYEI